MPSVEALISLNNDADIHSATEDNGLLEQFSKTRQQSVDLCRPLEIEDYGLQAAAFTSPPKWHLAHTSWFFETFLLKPFCKEYTVFHTAYEVLFNSYYNAIGKQYSRPQRGLLSRPTVNEVMKYRHHVDQAMHALLKVAFHEHYSERKEVSRRVQLGIQHEKQHQELFLTDLKYSLSKNPLYPGYSSIKNTSYQGEADLLRGSQWVQYQGGLFHLGADQDSESFSFDNESPAHQVYIEPFELSDRLVTNAEFQVFIDDGGYHRPEFWLSDGWAEVQREQWRQPLYWLEDEGCLMEFTLYGEQSRSPEQPVCHLSAYEADAYACWARARLPTEAEWEFAAVQQGQGESISGQIFQPIPAENNIHSAQLKQLYDSCWQWTSSAYRPYPGFKVGAGAIGEYNGKFMCNQWVLRGGSCVSPANHLRPTYRNFFYPRDRWQFSGLRLARCI
ncbi:ergothioneine biosynthesis protein EgtB [Endozoicomonas elysicola]|uniref:Sulfatase maturase n=1 Tax=Endozoicomonas elysicola TaxID=305900 RepID=A0A081KDH4_9GAMM|nr:ergothioneine biosynthesis protein EgtB [Endozoicomonas elysicola]KEI72200.1 hypothetical protein GV64_17015 [Endozoicomonas elysicola]